MLIDWFTVIAQIVNFLILVGLLKYFLYGRILHAMDEREKTIASRLLDADARKSEAEQIADTHRQKIQELELQRDRILAQVKHEAEARRTVLLHEAREEVDRIRTRWKESVEQEKIAFLQDLRRRTVTHVYRILHRTLKDLADEDLESKVTKTFLDRLPKADFATWQTIKDSLNDGQRPLVVRSAFALPAEAKAQIIDVLQRNLTKDIQVRFDIAPDGICGIEVKAPGYAIAWSVEQYLESLEEDVSKALEEEMLGKA